MNDVYLFQDYEFITLGHKFETYDTEWHQGIIFYLPEGRFDISLNKIGWSRIIINYSDQSVKDLPFNDGTLTLLPSSIQVRKTNGTHK